MSNIIEKLGIEPDGMKLVHITPELAAEMLANNYETQRKLRAQHVNDLAREMSEGRFIAVNGQTILLGMDGKLYDGQHRLNAIVMSGCSYDMYVCASSDPEAAFLTVDNHAKRGVADYLAGVPNRTEVAALARVMYAVEHGVLGFSSTMYGQTHTSSGSGKHSPIGAPREEVVLYAREHIQELSDAVLVGKYIKSSLNNIGSTCGYTAFVAIVRYCGKSHRLNDFMEELSSDTPTSPVPNVLRKDLFASYTAGGRRNSLKAAWITEKLLVAYEAYVNGRAIKRLPQSVKAVEKYWHIVSAQRAIRRCS